MADLAAELAKLKQKLKDKQRKLESLQGGIERAEHELSLLRTALAQSTRAPAPASRISIPGVPRTAVFVDATIPREGRDSGSQDTLQQLTWLTRLGWRVRVHAVDGLAPDAPGLDDLLNMEAPDLLVLNRFHKGGRYLELLRHRFPDAAIVFQAVDLHGLREARRATHEGDEVLRVRAEAVLDRELQLAKRADLTVLVSEAEAQIVQARAPAARVIVMPLARSIDRAPPPLRARRDVGFLGSFAHRPNVDAVDWLTQAIWPRVLASAPQARLLIGGFGMDALRVEASGVSVVGGLSDADRWVAGLRLTVAPLRFGAGAKGKIVTSLANGAPCVATSLAIEGMSFEPGADIYVADDTEGFAGGIVKLLADDAAWTRFATAGHSRVSQLNSDVEGERRWRQMLVELGLEAG